MTRYRTIVADPPWDVKAGPLTGRAGFADAKGASRPLPYPSMSIAELHGLSVGRLAEDDAHLYLWTINRYVPAAYGLAEAWGFKPSTLLVWAKEPMGGGLGGTFGISTEFILFCRRGSLVAKRREGRTWWNWKRPYDERGKPQHSGKPEAFYDLVEQISPGPYLELFARGQRRLGWSTWGNEALQHVELGA